MLSGAWEPRQKLPLSPAILELSGTGLVPSPCQYRNEGSVPGLGIKITGITGIDHEHHDIFHNVDNLSRFLIEKFDAFFHLATLTQLRIA